MSGLDARPDPPPDGFSRLLVTRTMRADPGRLAALVQGPWTWLGPEVAPAPPGLARQETDLRLRVSDHPTVVTFRKAAFVDHGPFQATDDGGRIEIAWRASTLAPLFPVFSGELRLEGHEATLSGLYAPPGGAVGRVADRALLRMAATGTARWLLATLDRAARGELER
jgi:hypothetical protein